MANHLGVKPDPSISSPGARKRHAVVSVADPAAPWTLKRPKATRLEDDMSWAKQGHMDDTASSGDNESLQFAMDLTTEENTEKMDAADPNQPSVD